MRYQKIKPKFGDARAEQRRSLERRSKYMTWAWGILLIAEFILAVTGAKQHWGIGIVLICMGLAGIGLAIGVTVLQSKVIPLPWYGDLPRGQIGEKQRQEDISHLRLTQAISTVGMLLLSVGMPVICFLYVFNVL